MKTRRMTWIGCFVVIAVATSCSLEPKSNRSKVYLSFSPGANENAVENPVDVISSFASSPGWPMKSAPSTAAGFPCFAVNVVGPGITDSSAHPEPNFDFQALANGTSYCSYRGVLAGPLYPGAAPLDVSLSVPAGANRIIQVLGIDTATDCPTALLPDDSNSTANIYEVGRWRGDLFGDRSIDVAKTFPDAAGNTSAEREARRVNCDNGACSLSSGGAQESGGIVVSSSNPAAQRVTLASPSYLKSIDLYLSGSSVAQGVQVKVMSDSSGVPGAVVDASRGVSNLNVPASTAQWFTFNFGVPGDYHLLASGTYWIVVTPSSGPLRWNSGAAGSPGQAKINQSSLWTIAARVTDPQRVDSTQTSSCALNGATGKVQCWGYNVGGEFGDGSTVATLRPSPGIGAGSGFVDFALGNQHGCGIDGSGSLSCWGTNVTGQLGIGNTTDQSNPVVVGGITNVSKVDASQGHTCAITTSGAAYCWGANSFGEVGDGTSTQRTTPTAVSGLAPSVTDISAANLSTCAVVGDAAKCWGYNNNGQLGNGTTTTSMTPVQVSGLTSGVTAIEVGNFYACAIVGGLVKCWGNGVNGELGNGAAVDSLTPTTVSGLSGVTQIALGSQSACALDTSGAVYCWGDGTDGQLGHGATTGSNVPVAVSGLGSGVTAIGGGDGGRSFCAIQGGQVYCWGDGQLGQLGQGNPAADSSTPVLVRGADQFAHRFYRCGS